VHNTFYVEDHPDTRIVMSKILRTWGFSVFTASSLADARQVLRSQRVDLILADIGLPDGTGWDLFAEARSMRPVHGLALSAWETDEDKARSERVGFRRHLTKPVPIDDLHDALLELVACTQDQHRD
jgi:CheY-like chemotaxis protein